MILIVASVVYNSDHFYTNFLCPGLGDCCWVVVGFSDCCWCVWGFMIVVGVFDVQWLQALSLLVLVGFSDSCSCVWGFMIIVGVFEVQWLQALSWLMLVGFCNCCNIQSTLDFIHQQPSPCHAFLSCWLEWQWSHIFWWVGKWRTVLGIYGNVQHQIVRQNVKRCIWPYAIVVCVCVCLCVSVCVSVCMPWLWTLRKRFEIQTSFL